MNNRAIAHLWANEKKESANGSNFFFEGESIYYDQISEVVYLAKIILEEMEGKDHGESS